jgi:hypothetical protein
MISQFDSFNFPPFSPLQLTDGSHHPFEFEELMFSYDLLCLILAHCWELMRAVGRHGSLLLQFVMKKVTMVGHFK